MDSLIGNEVRRITFTLHKEGKYHFLFSVMEEMQPDFQDYNDYRAGFVCERIEKTARSSKGKIYFSIDFPIITKEFLENPADNFILEDPHHTQLSCQGKFLVNPTPINSWWLINRHSLPTFCKAFPSRKDTKYLKEWVDKSFSIPAEVLNSEDLSDQLANLSEKHYGVNLCHHPEILGKIILIRYNHYYRDIQFSMSENPPGVYAVVDGIRKPERQLNIEIVNKNHVGLYEYSVSRILGLKRSNHFFPLPDIPECIEILLKDAEDRLVDVISPVTFIKNIGFEMNVASSRLSLTHRDGENEEVHKTVTEKFEVKPLPSDQKAIIKREKKIKDLANKQAYETLEKNLAFAFFDGSKAPAEKAQNRIKAIEFIKKILSKAKQKCIVADPYFNLNCLTRYIFTMPQSRVVVRVFGSKEHLNTDFNDPQKAANVKKEKRDIRKAIADYTKAYPDFDVQFKLLKGEKSPLHDRYIIVDNNVWMVGTSFNEIGARASAIIKLPDVSARRIISELESWWTNANISEPI